MLVIVCKSNTFISVHLTKLIENDSCKAWEQTLSVNAY